MGTWIESHTTLRTHKKLKMLCEELEINRREAIGLLHCLWWWAIENRENGDLSGLFEKDIATACDWEGDSKKLVKALTKCEWLIDYKIKNWLDYAGKLLRDRESKKRYRERMANEKRTDRERTENGHSSDASVPTVPYRTVPDRTGPNTRKVKSAFFSESEVKILENILIKDLGYSREGLGLGANIGELWLRSMDREKPIAYALGILKDESETRRVKK